jgi:phosphopantetheinyl transferase
MPFYQSIQINESTNAYFWQITEDVTSLFRAVSLKDTSLFRLESMKSEAHQCGFLAVRMLLQHLDYNDFDLTYDTLGKPHLSDGKHISISHSHEFSCICISDGVIGIDLEKLKEKTLKIAPRFMDINHLENLSIEKQIEKATVIWGVKEAVFKIKNEKGISFPKHISERKFDLKDRKCVAELRFNNQLETFSVQFYPVESYIFVCAIPN